MCGGTNSRPPTKTVPCTRGYPVERLYLDLAKKFLDVRGVTYRPDGEGVMSPVYAQQHKPVVEQRKAVGHAVRAGYLYAGMADVSALTGDRSYARALDPIWHHIVDTKMPITGGLGSVRGIEGFGLEYVLPNQEAYNETCTPTCRPGGGATPGNPFCFSYATGATRLAKNGWYFLAATYDQRALRVYLDGRLDELQHYNPFRYPDKPIFDGGADGADVTVAQRAVPSWPDYPEGKHDRPVGFAGRLGGLAVYRRALGAKEIQKIHLAAEDRPARPGGSQDR